MNHETEAQYRKVFNDVIREDVTQLINSAKIDSFVYEDVAKALKDHFPKRLLEADYSEEEVEAIVFCWNEGFSGQILKDGHDVNAIQRIADDEPIYWFSVEERFYHFLDEQDHLVARAGGLLLWGRYAGGQHVICDHVFKAFMERYYA